MPALDLIRPSVTAMRVIASVNAEFARELKLPPHIRSLGLISADSDDLPKHYGRKRYDIFS